MRRLTPAAVLLAIGGIVILVGLPLQWSSASFPNGSVDVARGLDYASYDVVTTVIIGLLLVVAGFAVAATQRWAAVFGVTVALIACLWGGLVVVAAANPANGSTSPGVNVSIGVGAFAVAAGALLGLLGAALSFRGRSVGMITSGAPSRV